MDNKYKIGIIVGVELIFFSVLLWMMPHPDRMEWISNAMKIDYMMHGFVFIIAVLYFLTWDMIKRG